MRQRLFISCVTALTIAVIGGLGYVFQKSSKSQHPSKTSGQPGVTILKDQIQSLSPVISGKFYLNDHQGQSRSHLSFRGRLTLVYFGYTYCPDICPQALSNVSQTLYELKDDAKQLDVLFISIDPARDQTFRMAQYLENYHPQIIGLTGSPKQVHAAAEAFKVYYNQVDDKQNDSQTPDQQNDYLMDHSSIIYVMDKHGQFITSFNHQTDPATMTAALRTLLQK